MPVASGVKPRVQRHTAFDGVELSYDRRDHLERRRQKLARERIRIGLYGCDEQLVGCSPGRRTEHDEAVLLLDNPLPDAEFGGEDFSESPIVLTGHYGRWLTEPEKLRMSVRKASPSLVALVDKRVDIRIAPLACRERTRLPSHRDVVHLVVLEVGEGAHVAGGMDDDLMASVRFLESRVLVGDDPHSPARRVGVPVAEAERERLRRGLVLAPLAEGTIWRALSTRTPCARPSRAARGNRNDASRQRIAT
jgi:hypothetical protein